MTRVVVAAEIARNGEAQAGGNRSRAVRRTEGVVRALLAAGEAGEPAALAQAADTVTPAGQDLVRIALMGDIPDQPVIGRVEDMVQGRRQFDDTKAGAQVAAGHRDRLDHLRTQFVGEVTQLSFVEFAQIRGF